MSNLPPAWEHVAAGAKVAFPLSVVARAGGGPVELPVLVARGRRPGKTLLVSAGVHGDEFEGMAAIHRVYEDLDPSRMSGTFVAVPVVNPPAYEAGLRTNPDDRQDMARLFPGDPKGTATEQLAYAFTWGLIRHTDLYADLHSAGQYYTMPPLAGYQLRPEPLLTIQREAARLMGLPLVWGTPGLPGRSLSAAAELGVPAVYVETTGEGRCRPQDVAQYAHGVRQLLAYLGVTPDRPEPYTPRWVVEDDRPQAGFLQVQNRAPVGGFFVPEVEIWGPVQKGQRLGVIRDLLGAARYTAHAPHTGRVVFLRTYPRVLPGDPVCTVLALDEA